MTCLDDPTVLRFVTGGLDDLAHRRAEEEIGRCGRCAALVAALIRDRHPPDLGGEATDADRADEGVIGDEVSARYVLGRVIARGGMGTIVAAYDRRLGRAVAIKRLDSDRAELAARFAREIRVTAALQHPRIVPIYDSGRLPDRRPFFAMRHVPGTSLEQAIAGARTDGERMALLAPVLAAAEAVAYAHERGVVHRDLKPSNILVGPFGETVVIDWGLARTEHLAEEAPAHEPAGADLGTTLYGTVLGTPRTMSPEQARGERASFPSDVYSLGGILYHALSGSPPVGAGELDSVLERVARSEVAPLARVAPALPPDLTAIVDRAMAPRPDERYATAAELAADLRRFQTGQLVAAHSYSRGDLLKRFVRRHRGAVSIAALCVVVIAVVGAVSVGRIVSESEQADQQRRLAERERAGAEDLVEFLVYDIRGKLRTVGRLDVLSGVADRIESYYLATASGRAESPVTLRARAELDDLRAEVANSSGDGASADRHLARGMTLLERAPPAARTDEVRAALFTSMALRAARRGELERARSLYLQAATLRRDLRAADPAQRRRNDIEAASLLNRAAVMAERLGAPPDAERLWKQAVGLLDEQMARDHDDVEAAAGVAEIEMAVGQNRARRGDAGGARAPLDRAVAAADRLTAREPRNAQFQRLLAWAYVSRADLAGITGDLDAADRLSERARDAARLAASIEPASVAWRAVLGRAEMNVAQVALGRKDWDRAAEHLDAARSAYEELVARDPSDREVRRGAAVALAQLAEAEAGRRNTAGARAAWQAALVHFARLAGSGEAKARLEWANGLRLYAALERSAGRGEAADQAIQQAVAIADQAPAIVERTAELAYRAGVLLEAGRADRAHRRLAAARRAWERGAALLRARAKVAPLEPESAELLRAIDAELSREAAQSKPRETP